MKLVIGVCAQQVIHVEQAENGGDMDQDSGNNCPWREIYTHGDWR